MAGAVRRSFWLVSLSMLMMAAVPAYGVTWPQPTTAELRMTADPKAPGADAVYLYREEIVNDQIHIHQLTAEIKILTAKGKQEYSDVMLPYDAGMGTIGGIEGRTIERNGTVIPFQGQPYNKMVVRQGGMKIMEKVFSLPDVQVGSVIEYRWVLRYDAMYYLPPQWIVQRRIYVHEAHYNFLPTDMNNGQEIMVKDALGHESPANGLLYFEHLPAGVEVTHGVKGYDLVVHDIPALPEEPNSPPLGSYAYQVMFYYSPSYTGQDFWVHEGHVWSKEVNGFARKSLPIQEAVAQITAGATTPEAKLAKIYAAVMTVQNTDFTRAQTAEENKAEGVRTKTAADIWTAKRGSGSEITRLFIAMVRAAGMNAYDMIVPERDQTVLNTGYLYWGQLTDELAIVEVGGKEQYFDPGERYCEFGKLDWKDAGMEGMRQSAKGMQLAMTPQETYAQNETLRTANLTMTADGKVSGIARITMSGAAALRWRQDALRTDVEQAKKDFAASLQKDVPVGMQVKVDHFLGLTDDTTDLMAVVNVSGSEGTAAGKLLFVPGEFFEAIRKPRFAAQTREAPIDLDYPHLAQDQVTWTLAPGLKVKSLPASTEIPYLPNADYRAKYSGSGNSYTVVRLMVLGNAEYSASQYGALRKFYQTTAAQDQQQVVLKRKAQ